MSEQTTRAQRLKARQGNLLFSIRPTVTNLTQNPFQNRTYQKASILFSKFTKSLTSQPSSTTAKKKIRPENPSPSQPPPRAQNRRRRRRRKSPFQLSLHTPVKKTWSQRQWERHTTIQGKLPRIRTTRTPNIVHTHSTHSAQDKTKS